MKWSLLEISELTDSELLGDPNYQISAVADLESAAAKDISFFAPPAYVKARYETALAKSQAGAIFIKDKALALGKHNYLLNESPSRAFQTLIEHFYADRSILTAFKDIHETAVIHESATVEEGVQIGPYVVIEKDVHIAKRSRILAHSYIGIASTIGEDCIIYPHVTIREHCTIGNRVILQSGSVIGSCGFGYTTNEKGEHSKLQQLGNVKLADDVEIGANSCIDRSRFKTTFIDQGTKIDNLVQIAHGVEMGKHNIMVSLCAIAGSTKLGDRVVVAGQSAFSGHLKIASDCLFAARSGITKSISKSGRYAGMPATPLQEYNREKAHTRRLSRYAEEIKDLKKRIAALEEDPIE